MDAQYLSNEQAHSLLDEAQKKVPYSQSMCWTLLYWKGWEKPKGPQGFVKQGLLSEPIPVHLEVCLN